MNRLPRGEKGAILVWMAAGLAVLIAFAGLATDIPYLYVARQQLQTAADAGALAGAYGLLVNQGQAVTDARALAGQTPVIGQALTPGQVDVFLESSTGGPTPDQVRCVTYRDLIHGNPLPLFLLPILQIFGLGRTTADVSATATAAVSNTCSSDCFKPWAIPDRWIETNGNGQFDAGIDTYIPPTGGTGYQYPADNGLQVTLKVGTPADAITPGFFYAVALPSLHPPDFQGDPEPGGAVYREKIRNPCAPNSFVGVGDRLVVEPGNMVGPTKQGVQDLIARDPGAIWGTNWTPPDAPPDSGFIENSAFPGLGSPRLVRMAFFDPTLPVASGRTYVTVVNVGGFFIEGVQPNGDVTGVYTSAPGFGGAPNPLCSFLQMVQMVQ